MMSMTNRTLPLTDRKVFSLFVDISTDITSLRGWEVSVYFHNLFAVPFCLVGKHGNETAPACISNGFGKVMISLHTLYIQILDADGIVSSNKRDGALMKIVCTAIGNLFVKFGNFEPLVFKPSAAFLLTGKMSLCFSKFALVSSCVSVILKSFSLGSDKHVSLTSDLLRLLIIYFNVEVWFKYLGHCIYIILRDVVTITIINHVGEVPEQST